VAPSLTMMVLSDSSAHVNQQLRLWPPRWLADSVGNMNLVVPVPVGYAMTHVPPAEAAYGTCFCYDRYNVLESANYHMKAVPARTLAFASVSRVSNTAFVSAT